MNLQASQQDPRSLMFGTTLKLNWKVLNYMRTVRTKAKMRPTAANQTANLRTVVPHAIETYMVQILRCTVTSFSHCTGYEVDHIDKIPTTTEAVNGRLPGITYDIRCRYCTVQNMLLPYWSPVLYDRSDYVKTSVLWCHVWCGISGSPLGSARMKCQSKNFTRVLLKSTRVLEYYSTLSMYSSMVLQYVVSCTFNGCSHVTSYSEYQTASRQTRSTVACQTSYLLVR
jgi:hypothetical protein